MTQINQILNDPERMKEITDLAASLGLSQVEAPANLPNDIPENISHAIHSVQKKDEKQQALVRALLPYLRPNHQKKLEQAIQLVQLTHLAGMTMQTKKSAEAGKGGFDDI